MAVNYTNLFNTIGTYIKRVNNWRGFFTNLDTDQSEILTELTTSGDEDFYSGIPELIDSNKNSILGWISGMIGKTDQAITDRDNVLEQLPILSQGADPQAALAELVKDMNDQSQSVNRSTVTLGSITKDHLNASAGELVWDKILDGVNNPDTSARANPEYKDVDSELARSETHTWKCVDNDTEGAESWEWHGAPGLPDPHHWQNEGSDTGPTLNTLNGNSLVSNNEFENFTSNAPDSWTIEAGTAGTHIFEDTDSADVHRGSSSLRLLGDAAATIRLSQNMQSPEARRKYCLAAWVKGNASLTAGQLTIRMAGTGYTPGASESITMNLAALQAQTTYGIEVAWFNAPEEIPSDFRVEIEFSGPASAHDIHIDGLVLGEAVFHGGVAAAVVAGADPFIPEDRFTGATTQNGAGVVQEYFRKTYGVQLPSSGTPTIPDSVAT